jgi:hypothetical protein
MGYVCLFTPDITYCVSEFDQSTAGSCCGPKKLQAGQWQAVHSAGVTVVSVTQARAVDSVMFRSGTGTRMSVAGSVRSHKGCGCVRLSPGSQSDEVSSYWWVTVANIAKVTVNDQAIHEEDVTDDFIPDLDKIADLRMPCARLVPSALRESVSSPFFKHS